MGGWLREIPSMEGIFFHTGLVGNTADDMDI
jgi:hypothetical protein